MRKLVRIIISSILLLGLLAACSSTKASNVSNSEDQTITLFFSDSNAEFLVGEERKMKDVTPQKAIQALIEGPKDKKLKNTLPEELEVSNVSIQDDIAHVFIHESVPLDRHGNYGSSTATSHIVNSISATLILHESFGIKKVKLEGDIVELLYGIDTNEPFDINWSLVKEKQ